MSYNQCHFGAGYIRFKDGFQERFPVEDYLELFDLAAHNIQAGVSRNSSGDHSALQLITGEHLSKCLCVWVGIIWYLLVSIVHQMEESLAFYSFHSQFSEDL